MVCLDLDRRLRQITLLHSSQRHIMWMGYMSLFLNPDLQEVFRLPCPKQRTQSSNNVNATGSPSRPRSSSIPPESTKIHEFSHHTARHQQRRD
ncbi:hypothetical protein VTH06DRAFT_5799 [Thermothelomyces fergusii]